MYVRDWLYVEDHCEAVDAILTNGKNGETYCVGSMTQDISNLEIAKKICALMDKNPGEWIEFVKDRPGHDRRYAIDFTKISTELGWKPKHSFNDALTSTIEWYKTNESWWKNIKSGEYQEYYKKQYAK